MSSNFIKKNWQKDATDVAINSGIRVAGAFAASFAIHKWLGITKDPTTGKEKKTLYNIGGPLLLAAGVLGDMMIEEPKLRAFCQGLAAYGGVHAAAVLSPDTLKDKWGIQGIGEEEEEDAALMSGVGALGFTTDSTASNLMGDAEDIAELSAGQETYNDTDGKTYNNDWAYLAENIDQADNITKTVSGVEEEEADPSSEAAELMGADSEEEAAILMGMF